MQRCGGEVRGNAHLSDLSYVGVARNTHCAHVECVSS